MPEDLSDEQLELFCPVGSRWLSADKHTYCVVHRYRELGAWKIKMLHEETGEYCTRSLHALWGGFVRLTTPTDTLECKTAAALGFPPVQLSQLTTSDKLVLLRHSTHLSNLQRPELAQEALVTTACLIVTDVTLRFVNLIAVDVSASGVFHLYRGTLAPSDAIWKYLVHPPMSNTGQAAGLVPGLVPPGSFWVRAPTVDEVRSKLGNRYETTYAAEFEPVMVIAAEFEPVMAIDNRLSIRTVDVEGNGEVWVPARFLAEFVPLPARFLSPKQRARLLAAADGARPPARRPPPSTVLDATQQKLLKASEEAAEVAKAHQAAREERMRQAAYEKVGRAHRARVAKAAGTPDGTTTAFQFDPTLPPTTTSGLSTPEPNDEKDMKMSNTNRTTTVWATMDAEGDLHIAWKRKDLPNVGGDVRRLQLPSDLLKEQLLDAGIINAEHSAWNDVIGAWTDGETPLPRKTRVKNQATALVSAAALGGALATMDKIGDLLLDTARKFAPQVPGLSAMLEHPMGREAVKILMAVSLHTVAYQTDLLPKKEVIARVAEWQISMSTMKLVAPQLELLTALVSEIVTSGERLPITAPSLKMFSGAADIVDADVTKAERARA